MYSFRVSFVSYAVVVHVCIHLPIISLFTGLCRLKNPTVISIWFLVGFHPATRSVQSTPADNTRKRVWQYIEKEKKRKSRTPKTVNGTLLMLKSPDFVRDV